MATKFNLTLLNLYCTYAFNLIKLLRNKIRHMIKDLNMEMAQEKWTKNLDTTKL